MNVTVAAMAVNISVKMHLVATDVPVIKDTHLLWIDTSVKCVRVEFAFIFLEQGSLFAFMGAYNHRAYLLLKLVCVAVHY